MQLNKVVAHSQDNTILKGTTVDFFPNKPSFHLETPDGAILVVEIDKLKALFFVKDLAGDPRHQYQYDDAISGAGRKIRVHFRDGETLVGYTQGYSKSRPSFFVIPGDLQGNNERVFVVSSACDKVEFL